MKGLKLSLILFTVIFLMASAVFAADEIQLTTDRLNHWAPSTAHTINIDNAGTAETLMNFTLPTGWDFSSSGECTNVSAEVTCTIPASGSGSLTITSPASCSEYTTTTISPHDLNGTADERNNITFLCIDPGEIFHTLVEYGRGRGNYFYDSFGGTAGSGKTGTGCSDVPAGTVFELNYLHKILNIQQYFELTDATGYNISFTCVYNPNVTSVRQHLTTSIARDVDWTVDYFLPLLEGSWERMGYFTLDYGTSDLAVGDNITVNCTTMIYNLSLTEQDDGYYSYSIPYGDIVIDEDSFTLNAVNASPFTVTASSNYVTGYLGLYTNETTDANIVGNGTQELLVTYTITNTGTSDLDDIVIEIDSPTYGQFIGVRGELWGSALDKYRYERLSIPAGGSEVIELVVRFDTTNAGAITSLDLADDINIRYTPCWEANAYNPTEYIQTIDYPTNGTPGVHANVTVDMSFPVSIISLMMRIDNIYDIVQVLEGTLNRAVMVEDVGQDCAIPGEGLNFAWTFRDILGEDVASADIFLNATADCTLYYVDPSGTNDVVSGETYSTLVTDGLVEVKWTNTRTREHVMGTYEIVCDATLDVNDAPHADSDDHTYPVNNGSVTTNVTTLKAHGMLQASCGGGEGGDTIFKGSNNTNIILNNESFNFFNDSNTNGQVSNCDDMYSGLKYHAEIENLNNFTTTPTLEFIFPWPVDNTDLISEPATGTTRYLFRSNDVVAEWTGTLTSGQVLDLNWTWKNVYCEYFNDIFEEINLTRNATYECNTTVWKFLTDLERNELRKELEKLDDMWDDIQDERDSWYDTSLTTPAEQSAQSVTSYFESVREMWYWEWDRRVLDTYVKCQLLRDIYLGGQSILEKLERMEEFNEEMVFLITDSLVLQKEASNALADGDRSTATDKLMLATEKLKQVSNQLTAGDGGVVEEESDDVSITVAAGWWLPMLIVIMIVILGAYLFSRPKEPVYVQPPEEPRY
ncbi:hypothetical protein ACFL96_08815 [Thermoproteota archaeon]